jgi:general secretion pathway protein K
MLRRMPANRPRERGLALIAVLWGLVLLAAIAASVTVASRTETRLARNLVANAEAQALAEAGVNRAVLGLATADPERQLRVDGTSYRLVFGGGEVFLTIRDEGGKIDLNRAPDSVLRGLFATVGVGPDESAALVDAIVDYRDANDARRLNGAEDSDYRRTDRSYGAKDQPFEAVDELLHVLGMTPELYEQVAPALTVHSRRRRVDPATAPALVLRALPGLDPAELDHSRRRRVDPATAPALVLRALPGLDPAELDERLAVREEAEAIEDDPVELQEDEGAGPVEGVITDVSGTQSRSARRGRSRVVTVRAEARTTAGVNFIREAVVRLGRSRRGALRVVAWGQGTAKPAARPQ